MLYTLTGNNGGFMKTVILTTAITLGMFSASFAGEGWNNSHVCDPKIALFSDKISKAIEMASLDSSTLLKVDQLTTECHYEVSLGLSTYDTAKCKSALELVGVN